MFSYALIITHLQICEGTASSEKLFFFIITYYSIYIRHTLTLNFDDL